MLNKYGVFINLDYAHKPQEKCSKIWEQLLSTMLQNDFSFEKRAFVIATDKTLDDISVKVRSLLDEVETTQSDIYSYLTDCYILNFDNCTDLTLPDASNIDVEDISMDELDAFGVKYDVLFEKDK